MYIVESSFMESFTQETKKAIEAIKKIFTEFNIHFIFIGGITRNEYISPRITDDIDLLVSKKDQEKLSKLPIGYIKKNTDRTFTLHNPKTKIEVLFSGEKAGSEKGIVYKEPTDLDNGNSFLTLKDFIHYKLSSGLYGKRMKDYGDIQDCIKQKNLPIDYADSFRQDLKKIYRKLWKDTNNSNFELT